MSSRWQQIHACQPSSRRRITGSLTPVFSSPSKTRRVSPVPSAPSSGASTAPIHQCLLSGVAQHTYSRQPPSIRMSAGRSTAIAPKCDSSSVTTVANRSPSSERATTVASFPSCPLRTR
jgi:hypothetical protein